MVNAMESVLIVGGSGFLGHGLVRRLLDGDCERICIFSRDEYKQSVMREEFEDSPRLRWFVGDVRDRDRLRRAMEGVDHVISAAALKRVETAENNPTEVVKTNVFGVMNIIDAAYEAGVKKIIGISTDKAPEAANVYGATKFLSERLLTAANKTRGARGPLSSCVRYGNVAGSTGSVIPKWRAMVKRGLTKVPCTEIACTRYWMRLDDAARFVLDSLETMLGGEVFIPELPAYRLGDLAEAMGVDLDIIGLPSSEKLHETMDGKSTSETARRMSIAELRGELEML